MRILTEVQTNEVGGGGAYHTAQAAYQEFANNVQAGAQAVADGADYAKGFVVGFVQGLWNEA